MDFRQTAQIHLAVRRTGAAVRSLVESLIAAMALRHDVGTLHADADFAVIAECLRLRMHDG